jgi:hypothetical protein
VSECCISIRSDEQQTYHCALLNFVAQRHRIHPTAATHLLHTSLCFHHYNHLLLFNKEQMHTMNLARVIKIIALFAALIASAVGSREGTSAWHVPPKEAFGIRKSSHRSSPQSLSAVTITMDQQEAPSDNLLGAIHHDDDESELGSHQNQRIIPATARAAVVAFVSAAAIGTTRHALERFIPI